MCLIVLAWRCHEDFPLVLAANRDEFFARPTASLDWWEHPRILAGRDEQGGGTWLGVARDGRIAALTNIRDPARHRADAASRGALVVEALQAPQLEPWLTTLSGRAQRYNGFNLLVGDAQALYHFHSASAQVSRLQAGVHGLSNGALNQPWPKVARGKARLTAALAGLPARDPLFELLADTTIAPDDLLPHTGVSLEWERLLSPAFIRSPTYGTRCSSVLLQRADGELLFEERRFDAAGQAAGRDLQRFHLSPSDPTHPHH